MYDDQPPYGAMERAMEGYFRDHPLARRVLGTRETVSELDPEAMRAYHQARYAPDNLTLVASGAVDFQQLLKSAEAMTTQWKPSQAKRQLLTPTYCNDKLSMVHPPATQQYTLQYSPGPSYCDDARTLLAFWERLSETILAVDFFGSWLILEWQRLQPPLRKSFKSAVCSVPFLLVHRNSMMRTGILSRRSSVKDENSR